MPIIILGLLLAIGILIYAIIRYKRDFHPGVRAMKAKLDDAFDRAAGQFETDIRKYRNRKVKSAEKVDDADDTADK